MTAGCAQCHVLLPWPWYPGGGTPPLHRLSLLRAEPFETVFRCRRMLSKTDRIKELFRQNESVGGSRRLRRKSASEGSLPPPSLESQDFAASTIQLESFEHVADDEEEGLFPINPEKDAVLERKYCFGTFVVGSDQLPPSTDTRHICSFCSLCIALVSQYTELCRRLRPMGGCCRQAGREITFRRDQSEERDGDDCF